MARMTSKTVSRGSRFGSPKTMNLSPEARQHMIGEAAYYRYVQRGAEPGHDVEDWLAAEADFEQASVGRQPRESAAIDEFDVQQSGARGPAVVDALKRMIKRHPRREISAIESIDPEEAPLKE